MQYREFEKLGIKTSLLGFGCMRFPTKEDGKIDEERAEKMLDDAIRHGVNYIDTAYPYHFGESELFVGKVLKKYPRDSFYLATKMPTFSQMKNEDDKYRLFNEQLERLQVDYFDFYLIHCINRKVWEEKILKFGVLDYLIEMKKQGKIKYLGFSFHDTYDVFENVLNAYDWDFCQIQYNYMDTDIQAGYKGYKLTEEKNIPLIIMEPIKGGSLANLPKDIEKIFKDYDPVSTASSWALRWVASHPNVKVILSGMSSEEQVKDNLTTMSRDRVELNEEEMNVVSQVKKAIQLRTKNGCTGCGYCMPCPFGVDIPENFSLWNDYGMYGRLERAKEDYEDLKDAQAWKCKKCGKCETICPQKIKIRQDLEKVHRDIGLG
ncbi:MAG: aldo/keto reductase [Traorella sp.]